MSYLGVKSLLLTLGIDQDIRAVVETWGTSLVCQAR